MTTTESRPEYLSCADTAKLVRQSLKREWPATKFSVRSHTYAGGASIDIHWTDGPTAEQVDAIAGGFGGGRFDGMIDLATNHVSWLEEDGSAHIAHDAGTVGSRGVHDEIIESPRTGGARLVHFGADYVFTNRDVSPALVAQCAELVERGYVHGKDHCARCYGWMKGDCYAARIPQRAGTPDQVRLVCSPECGGFFIATATTV